MIDSNLVCCTSCGGPCKVVESRMGSDGIRRRRRYECGSKEGVLQATVERALQHPEVGARFKAYLQGLKLD